MLSYPIFWVDIMDLIIIFVGFKLSKSKFKGVKSKKKRNSGPNRNTDDLKIYSGQKIRRRTEVNRKKVQAKTKQFQKLFTLTP